MASSDIQVIRSCADHSYVKGQLTLLLCDIISHLCDDLKRLVVLALLMWSIVGVDSAMLPDMDSVPKDTPMSFIDCGTKCRKIYPKDCNGQSPCCENFSPTFTNVIVQPPYKDKLQSYVFFDPTAPKFTKWVEINPVKDASCKAVIKNEEYVTECGRDVNADGSYPVTVFRWGDWVCDDPHFDDYLNLQNTSTTDPTSAPEPVISESQTVYAIGIIVIIGLVAGILILIRDKINACLCCVRAPVQNAQPRVGRWRLDGHGLWTKYFGAAAETINV